MNEEIKNGKLETGGKMTIRDHWDDYKSHCYPNGVSGRRLTEVHQAFFAGAMIMMEELQKVGGLAEQDALKAVRRLSDEVFDACLARVKQLDAGDVMNN
jgi:hypothetical protein